MRLVNAVMSLLDEQNLGILKALFELVVVMTSHCYLVGPPQSCLSNILYAIVLYQNMIELILKAPGIFFGLFC